MHYPGNTVISELPKGNPAFSTMQKTCELLERSPLARHLIFLPNDSYHITVIRGVNDNVRKAGYWPPALSLDAPMEDVDVFMQKAIESVQNPGPIRMRFDRLHVDDADVRVCVRPYDAAQQSTLDQYRDEVAKAVGFYLPGHETYTYHVTLAYVRTLSADEDSAQTEAFIAQVDNMLQAQAPFSLDAPHVAFYDDMIYFSHTRPDKRQAK